MPRVQVFKWLNLFLAESQSPWDPWIVQNHLAVCGHFQWQVYPLTPWLPGLMLEVHSSSDFLHSIDIGSSMLSDGNVTITHYADRGVCSLVTCTQHHQPSSNAASDTPRRVVGQPAAARVQTGHRIKASLLDQGVIQHFGTLLNPHAANPQADMNSLSYRFNSMTDDKPPAAQYTVPCSSSNAISLGHHSAYLGPTFTQSSRNCFTFCAEPLLPMFTPLG